MMQATPLVMEEDIFMDHTTASSSNTSSPVDCDTRSEVLNGIKMNFQKFGYSLESISGEKSRIISQLKLGNTGKEASNQTEIRLKILELRKFNRHLSTIITENRKRLNDFKDKIDDLNGKLLCQKFEKKHLLDEIKTCLSSKNIFETIELENDLEIEITNDQHELMIKRLQMELFKRKELQAQLISILQRKQQTETELQVKKQKIEDLRNHLQNLLKVSKPLIDACGYDLEAFTKKKMVIDSSSIDENGEAVKDIKSNANNCESIDENLNFIYEKLVNFVVDKSEYKLRYFEALNDDKVRAKGDFDAEEDEDFKDFDVEDGERDQNIKESYIQINLEIDKSALEPVNIYLIIKNSTLFLSIKHDLIPENISTNWLKTFVQIQHADDQNNVSTWMIPSKLQLFDSFDDELYTETFVSIKEALMVWSHLQSLVQDQEGKLEFDRNCPNELIYTESLRAKVFIDSITWSSFDSSHVELVSSLNSIGAKYRSVVDCLQAQLELL